MKKQNNLDKLQNELEKRAKLRAKKKKGTMKVSGSAVKNLQRIIRNKK